MRMRQQASGPVTSGAPASDITAAGDAATQGNHEAVRTPSADAHSASQSPASQSPASHGSASQNSGSHNGLSSSTGLLTQQEATTSNGQSGSHGPATLNGKVTGRAIGLGGRHGRRWTASALLALSLTTIRRHWIASALIGIGVVLRVLTEIAYHPAIIYIDTLKYLYDAWPGSDPVGYKVPLKLILFVTGSLSMVQAVQHLLGIAIAVTLYVVLIRRGAPRWLGALAIAPVLLDAYQLQAETMIMPDVWFEAMIAAGLAVLLWHKRPALVSILIGTALLGASTGVRQIGEIMIVPALILVVALGGGLKKMLINVVAVVCAFGLAIVLYMGAAAQLTGHFRLSYSSSSLTYGRMSAVVNCATLNVLPPERLLCPTKAEQAEGPDWLDHSVRGPLRTLDDKLAKTDPSLIPYRSQIISHFNRAVEEQQPLRVISGVLRDSVKLFALTRDTSPGDTPIWRWQFHGYFPTYPPYITVQNHVIYIALPQESAKQLNGNYGNIAHVDVPIARFLRSYQVNGGYTPGPLLLLFTIAGFLGSLMLIWRRRLTDDGRWLALGCLGFFAAAIAVIGMSDAFEFTWRYQLPALVTLPPAGALGIAVLITTFRRRQQPVPAQPVSERAPELAAPAQ
jgi:hypothetical protein